MDKIRITTQYFYSIMMTTAVSLFTGCERLKEMLKNSKENC